MIAAQDVEAIERATLRALPPRVLEQDDGWLLAANDGVVARANSVLPLSPGDDPLNAKIDRAIAFHARQGATPTFRISPFSQPAGLSDALAARGFTPGMPTVVMTTSIAGDDAGAAAVSMTGSPDASWQALFLAPGVGAREADIRVATLSRGKQTRFASLQVDEVVVAIGAASVTDGWVGIHGMRTLADHRGCGHGAAVLRSLLADAYDRGAERAFLQVEEDNTGAIRLYQRLGFRSAYVYDYRRQPIL